VRVKPVVVGSGVAVLATALVACSDPGTAPRPAAPSAAPSGPLGGLDPCTLIHPDEAKKLRLNDPHRSDFEGKWTACGWSTLFGSAVAVSLEQQVHTVDEYVEMVRAQEPLAPNLPARTITLSPWSGDRHHGTRLDWSDGHEMGVVITVSPTQIVTVTTSSDEPDKELGLPLTEVLRGSAAAVDRNLP
jgi:hypothetical protein